MYKRILSVALALLMLCGAVTVSVSAFEPSLESLFKDPFIEYIEQDGSSVDEEFLYINYIGSAGKCSVYRAYYGEVRGLETSQVIGDYKFTYGALVGDENTNPTGLYAWDEFGFGIMTLKEAYDKGYADLDALYKSEDYNRGIYPLTDGEKEECLKEKCKEAYVKEYGIDTGLLPARVEFAVQFENYAVFQASHIEPAQMESFQYIYGYWFYEPCILGEDDNNPLGLYTLDNYGNVESLYNTAGKSFIDMDEIFPELSEKCNMYLSGDIDSDKKLTVKDATLIQKYLAKLPEAVKTVYEHRLGYCVMEVDEPWRIKMFGGSSKVTVKDATYIQKKLAKMVFEEGPQPFYEDRVVTWVLDEAKQYTLEDFPEYSFERMEQEGSCIVLYLKEAGKANVVDAVNSLLYREGADLADITVEYIPTEDVYI
ncbi:MAG: hypothetical protein IJW04_04160 [Ruminococcus sp.]|nr:hypothetical protein [Ruminococcus sp.]